MSDVVASASLRLFNLYQENKIQLDLVLIKSVVFTNLAQLSFFISFPFSLNSSGLALSSFLFCFLVLSIFRGNFNKEHHHSLFVLYCSCSRDRNYQNVCLLHCIVHHPYMRCSNNLPLFIVFYCSPPVDYTQRSNDVPLYVYRILSFTIRTRNIPTMYHRLPTNLGLAQACPNYKWLESLFNGLSFDL